MRTVRMPQLGISEDSAILTAWHIKQGGPVKAGDKLFSIETGKSSFDVTSEETGTLMEVYAAEGDEVAVKAPVCAIGMPGEANASPRAKALAEKLGVNPQNAIPTGPDGRIIERDVRQLNGQLTVDSGQLPVGGTAPSLTVNCLTSTVNCPLSNMRKIIGKNMLDSLRNTAQLTHTSSFDAAGLLACRERFKADPSASGITLTDMILYTVSRTLNGFPALNAHLLDDTLRVFTGVNLAVAVDTERGLMVPVIFEASKKTLPEISGEAKILAERCRNGSISNDLLTGGSFTVSNLGPFGIESFTPILNTPQTGILGVCGIRQRVKITDGQIGAYPAMTLSLTYDHRALDGAPASRFLQTLCKALEDFKP